MRAILLLVGIPWIAAALAVAVFGGYAGLPFLESAGFFLSVPGWFLVGVAGALKEG